MKRVVTKLVQQFLLPEQKGHRAAVAKDLIQTATKDSDFPKTVITLMETEALLSYVLVFYIFFNKCLSFPYCCGWILSGQTLYTQLVCDQLTYCL